MVNYFGPGQGGTVTANVERWTAQMLGANGKPAPAKVTIAVTPATGAQPPSYRVHLPLVAGPAKTAYLL